ncbi:unnamed protein product [Pleuronectes platessa]|uniref:Gastrin-releasing peptide n=1 Tax=Pleuronectes platessa TaxID=8262 RepID=A0A9N7UFQ2_PLEPL|nr:gastrin-releasing peptide [Pleuronectes platessa]CAB1430071.1 unnamed protein product [Pleuronectes platessa]
MGGVCWCYSWTCRLWPLLILATLPKCVVQFSESPAAVVGKMYPRGNHWAVGHLMGKKSIENPPADVQGTNPNGEKLSETELDRFEPLMETLTQQKNQNQMRTQTADRLLQLHRGWREEDRDKYLRELSDLFLLALKLRGNDST